MTVTTTQNSISYAGNGTTKAFAFPYIFFAPSNLVVTLIVTATGIAVTPPPVLNGAATYDYTLTGVVTGGEYASGGTITFNNAPLGTHTVVIVRTVPLTQTVTLIDNTKFPADTINVEFDKLTVLAQQAAFFSAVSLQIPISEAGLIVTAVSAAARANKLLLWDGLGNLTTLDVANIIGGSVPAGPAGGDLAGVYPNPTIKPSVALTGTPTVNGIAIGNGFRLLQRTVVGAAVANIEIAAIPTEINDLMFTFDLTPVTVTAVNLALQFYINGAIDNSGAHYTHLVTGALSTQAVNSAVTATTSTSGAAFNSIILNYNNATRQVHGNWGIRGSGQVPNIRASRPHSVVFQSNYMADDLTGSISVSGGGQNNQLLPVTGLRVLFSGGNIASGSFSVWGSP